MFFPVYLFDIFVCSSIAKLYCSSSPCEHGGKCEEIENNYQCQCPTGYMGYNCEGRL